MIKNIKFPLTIKEIGNLATNDNTFYMVDYEKSELKGAAFIEYFGSISKICDITNYNNIDSETKYVMMDRHFALPEFVMLPSLVKSLVLCLLEYKGISYDVGELRGSFLTKSEIKEYLNIHKDDKFKKYTQYLDSLFCFMLIAGKYMINEKELTIEELDNQFKGIEVDDCSDIPILINSVLFEPLFDKYYEKSQQENNVKYYKKFWTEKLYKNHNIMLILTSCQLPTFKGILYMLNNAKKDSE